MLVTINAADSDAGLEGIYVNDVRVKTTSPYSFTISANNTSFTAYAMDLAGKKSDVVQATIDHIDKTVPTAPTSVPLSSSAWTNTDVSILMPALAPSTGAPERYVYQIGTSAWTDLPDGFAISAEGSTTIRVAVADEAGNRSGYAQATARIDKSKPVISEAVITSGSSTARVDVSATEVGASGLAKFCYAADEQTADFFTTGGTTIVGSTFTVSSGGTYTIFASDNAGNTTLKTISITTAPTFEPVADITMDEDETRHVSLSVSDAESSISELTIRVTTSNSSLLSTITLNQDDSGVSLDITPASNLSGGPATITVEVEDPSGQKVSRTFSVTVLAKNDDPVAVDDEGIILSEDGVIEIDVLANDSDTADNDPVSIHSVGEAAHGKTLLVLGKIRYTPDENYWGEDSFTYDITDGNGGSAQATVYITVESVNDAPVANDDNATTTEDTEVSIDVVGNDTDIDSDTDLEETISLVSATDGAHGTTQVVDGMVQYTPEANYNGTDVFTYTIEDRAGLTSEASVSVVITPETDAPWFAGLQDEYTIDEDAQAYEISFEIRDVETPADSLMLQAASMNAEMIAQSGVVLSGLGDSDPAVTLLLTPVANVNGDVSIHLTLGDGFETVDRMISIHITPVNDAPHAGSDTKKFTEDAEYLDISIASLLTNDSDIDGDSVSYDGLVSQPSIGTVAELDAETLRYYPPTNFEGKTSFTYYISDGTVSTIATCYLEGIGVNDTPSITVTPEQIDGTEDQLLVIPFVVADNESAASDLSVIVASSDDSIVTTDGIEIVINEDGTGEARIMPEADANGTLTATLTVSDGEAQSSDDVMLYLAPAQDAPVAEEDYIYVHYSSSRTFSVLVNDHDVDGDSLEVSDYTATLPGRLTFDADAQTFTYIPAIGENGISTFTYSVTDGIETHTAQVTLDVISETHAPLLSVIESQYVSEDGTISGITFSVSDEDIGDTAEITITSDNGTLLPNDAEHIQLSSLGDGNYSLSLTPTADLSGSVLVTVSATDSTDLTDSTSFTLYVIAQNDAPVATDDALSVNEDGALLLNLLVNDTDADGDTIWLSSLSSPSHGYIERVGNNYTYYPYADWSGTEYLTYHISDGRATAQANVVITVLPVNDAPIAWDDWCALPNETGLESANIDVLHNDYDVDSGDVVRLLEIVSGPTYGTLKLEDDGTITYTRNQISTQENGADSFVYKIIDRASAEGDYLSATATVHIGVHFTSSLYTYGRTVTCFEDADPFLIDLAVTNPTPVEYDLTVNTTTTLGSFEVIDHDTVRFTPAPDQYGYAAITYTVEQIGGGEKDTGIIWLRVYPVNDLPQITSAPTSVTFDEDSSEGATFDVLFHDADCANEYLYFYVYTQNGSTSAPVPFTVSYSVTRTDEGSRVTVKSAANVNGTGEIIVGVSDGMTYDEALITLNVTPVDDAPVVKDVYKTIKEDSSVTFTSPGLDSEVDGDTTKESVDPERAPQHGTVTILPDRTIHYVPDADFYGTDVFYLIVTDQTEAALSAAAKITIQVTQVNDPPEIYNLEYYQSTLEDEPKDVTLTVRDVDNDMTSATHYTLTSDDASLVKSENISISSVEGYDMVIHVIPEENAYGTVKINIVASDGSLSAKAAFSLKIVPVNDQPVATDDTAVVDEVVSTGAESTPPKTTCVIDLLSNDFDVEDGKPSIVSITNIVSAESVVNIGSGKVRVSAEGDFSGNITFTYSVMDRAGATDSANVVLTVNPVNDPPRAKDDSITIDEDETPLINVLGNDYDPEDDILSITDVTLPANGTAQISDTKILYTPNQDYFGTDTFDYTVSDGEGGTATASVTITIRPVNDAPTIAKHSSTSGDWSTLEDVPASFNFVVADAESAVSNLIIKITSDDQTLVKNTQIALSTNAEGYKTIRVTPEANMHGTLGLKIWVSDGLLSTEAVYPLEIISVNDAPVVTVPVLVTKEDNAISSSAYATDMEGDSVTFAAYTTPAHGTVTVRADGTFDYTPAKDYNGQDSFIIRADDGQDFNNFGYATVYITVKPDGDPPIALDDSITIDEDVATLIPVLENDTDEDTPYGDVIAILHVTTPTHGKAVIDGNNILYTPDEDYNGSDSFSYTISDRDGKTDTASVSITILPVNDAPRGGDDEATVLEDHSVDIAVTLNDDIDETTNPELEDVTILTVDIPANGTAEISTDHKTITYTPNENWFSPEGEPEVFYYTAVDAFNQTARFAVSVIVTSVNDLPVITPSELSNVATQEDTRTQDITFTVSDVETPSGELTVTATHLNGVLLPPITVSPDAAGVCTFNVLPNLNKVGDATITVKVKDGDGGEDSASFTLSVTAVNDPPAPGNDAFTVAENATYTADVLANDDVDIITGQGTDELTLLSISETHIGTVTIVGNKLYYVPKADLSTKQAYQDVFTYTMQDKLGNQCTPTVTVTVTPVNDAPTISAIADVNDVLEDAPDGTGDVSFYVADEEDDNDTLAVSIACTNTTLFPLSNISITNPTGDATGTLRSVKAIPAANQFGTATIKLTVRDTEGLTSYSEFTVTVTSVNDEPDNGDRSFEVVEDVETQLDILKGIDPDYATRPDDYTITAIASAPTHGTAYVAADGKSVYYKTLLNSNEADSFDYTVYDDYGKVSYTFTISITVIPVNDAPEIHYSESSSYTIYEGTQLDDIPFTVTDVDNDAYFNGTDPVEVTLSAKSSNSILLVNGIHIDTLAGYDRNIDLKPYLKWNGKTTVTITATDPDGLKDTASFELIVNNVNDAPVAVNDTGTIPEDVVSNIYVLANDTDADIVTNPDTESIRVASVTDEDPNATIVKSVDGLSVVVTPNENYNGPVSFSYTVMDASNAESNVATVSLIVSQVNDAPDAVDDAITTDEDTAVDIFVLTNDSDIDMQSGLNANPGAESIGVTLTGGGLTAPAHGTISTDGAKITYTPNDDYNGSDEFEYYCDDGETTTSAKVSVTIKQVNDSPEAVSDSATIDEDTATDYIDVMANDTDVDLGAELNQYELLLRSKFYVSAAWVNDTSIGTVEVLDNKVKFTPAHNWFGTANVLYSLQDGYGASSITNLAVTVVSVNDLPEYTTQPSNLELSEDGANGSFDIAVDDVETLKNDLVVTVSDTSNPSLIALTDVTLSKGTSGGWTITVNPKDNQNGTAVIELTLTDENGDVTKAEFTVSVAPVNDAPIAVDKTITLAEDSAKQTYDKATLVSDVDIATNADVLTLTITTPASHGTAAIDASGNVTYVPYADYNGTDSFVYTVTDRELATDTGTFNITMTQVNDAPDAVDDAITTDEDTAVDIFVLLNDSDIDKQSGLNANPGAESIGVTLTGGGLTAPAHGTISTDGAKITYTPNDDYNGSDEFEYYCDDGETTTSAKVRVTIKQVNDSPEAVSDSATIDEDTATDYIDVMANDTDVDLGAELNQYELLLRSKFYVSAAWVNDTSIGTVEVLDNKVKFTPAHNWFGTANVLYSLQDGYGASSITNLAVTVVSVNDLPEYTTLPSDLELSEDGADGSFDIAVDDVETLKNELVVTVSDTSNPSLISLTDVTLSKGTNGAWTITVNPKDNQNGTAVIELTLTDKSSGVTKAEFTVSVAQVNDAPVAVDKTITLTEDSAKQTYDKATLVSDVDIATNADVLTLTITTPASHGTAAIDANGNVTYVPYADYNGTDSFVYTVTDHELATDTGTFNITMTQVNDAPDAVDDAITTDEDTAVDIFVLLNDSDIDKQSGLNANPGAESIGVTLTGGGLTAPAHGTISTDGAKITYTPNDDYNGSDEFEYYCDDGETTTSAKVSVTIKQVNDSPEAVSDSVTIDEDTATDYIDVMANDTDVDLGAELNQYELLLRSKFYVSAAWVNDTSIGTVEVLDNKVKFTPAHNWFGTANVLYSLQDGYGASSITNLAVTVVSVNDLPEYTTLPSDLELSEDGANGSFDIAVDDVETLKNELVVTVSDTSNPSLIALTDVTLSKGTNGAWTITVNPKDNQNGTAVIELTLTDENSGVMKAEFTVSVAQVNDAPVAVDKTITLAEDSAKQTYDKATLVSDVDIATNADVLTLTITTPASHGTAAIDANGNVTYVPYADYNGTDSFVYTVTDRELATDTGTFNITMTQVNDAPDAVDDAITTDEDTAVDIFVLLNDSDIDKQSGLNANPGAESIGVTLTGGSLTAPAHGTISTDGAKITYTPNDDYNGSDEFEYYCDDGESTTSAKVSVTIKQVNDNPIANDDSTTTDEDTPVSYDVVANDTDVDTIAAQNQDQLHSRDDFSIERCYLYGAENGTAEVDGNAIRFTPDSNFQGTQIIKYVLLDGMGGTSTGTLTIQVASENDAPVAADDTMSAQEDHTASVNVLDNDTDVDIGDTKTLIGFLESTSTLPGTITKDANGDVTFTPNANYNGSFELTYQMRDTLGLIDTAKLRITITPVNDAPVADNANVTSDEDTKKDIDVTTLVSDVDIATNDDVVAITIAESGKPAHGTATLSGSVISYMPDDDFNGADELTYTATDAAGAFDTGVITITVNAVSDAPLAQDDSKTTTEDTAVEIAALANDQDIDTDDILNLEPATAPYILSVTDGLHGSATTDGATIEYTPDENYNGTDLIEYVISDGILTDTAQVSITITQVNDTIKAVNDAAQTNDEDMVSIDVLGNDTDVDTDATLNKDELHQRESFRITAVGTPEHGTAVIVSGKIEYTPEDRFSGTDSFVYTVSDGHGSTANALVTVTVLSVNDAPVILIVSSPKEGDRAGTGSEVSVEWTGFDIDGDALTYRLEYFDGKDWLLISNDLTETKYVFAIPDSLGSTNGLKFRVNVRDSEFTSDYGYSGAMSVDKDAPKGTIVSMKTADGRTYTAGTWTNQTVSVVATSSVDASKVTYYYDIDGGTSAAANKMDVTSGVHTVNITAVDEYGNAAVVGAYLARVDKQQPSEPVIRESISGGNVLLTLTLQTDPGGSGNDKITMPDGTIVRAAGNPVFTTNKNATVSFTLTDIAGNRRSFEHTVTSADVSKPVITLNSGSYRIGSTTQDPIVATLSFTDGESNIVARGYQITTGSTFSGAYRTYDAALRIEDAGTYYIHAYARNAFGLTTYESFGPFIVEAEQEVVATPAPQQTGDVLIEKGDVEEVPGDTVKIRFPGQDWNDTLTLEDVGPGTYLIEAMDEDGNVRTVEVRVTMRDIISRSLRSSSDQITAVAIALIAAMAIALMLLLLMMAGYNITIVINGVRGGSRQKMRTMRRIMLRKNELVIKLEEKQLAGGDICELKIAKHLSKRMRNNIVIVTMRGNVVLREEIPKDFDEAFKRTIPID